MASERRRGWDGSPHGSTHLPRVGVSLVGAHGTQEEGARALVVALSHMRDRCADLHVGLNRSKMRPPTPSEQIGDRAIKKMETHEDALKGERGCELDGDDEDELRRR